MQEFNPPVPADLAGKPEPEVREIVPRLVVDAAEMPVGILTRSDVLGRITLADLPLTVPIGQVMVQPVRTLTHVHTAQDAALLMTTHGIRHVPVTRDGRAMGVVSERDLFALQRLSIKQVSSSIRHADDLRSLHVDEGEVERALSAGVLLACARLGRPQRADHLNRSGQCAHRGRVVRRTRA